MAVEVLLPEVAQGVSLSHEDRQTGPPPEDLFAVLPLRAGVPAVRRVYRGDGLIDLLKDLEAVPGGEFLPEHLRYGPEAESVPHQPAGGVGDAIGAGLTTTFLVVVVVVVDVIVDAPHVHDEHGGVLDRLRQDQKVPGSGDLDGPPGQRQNGAGYDVVRLEDAGVCYGLDGVVVLVGEGVVDNDGHSRPPKSAARTHHLRLITQGGSYFVLSVVDTLQGSRTLLAPQWDEAKKAV